MICINDCGNCKHIRPLIDGWLDCCDAFPEGIPIDFDYSSTKKKKICNNGIGYEPKEKDKE